LKTNNSGDKELIRTLFGTKIQGTWDDFVNFCETNFASVNVDIRIYRKRIQELLPIYQAFLEKRDRKAFVDFCAPYSVGANKEDKLVIMKNLLPIYQAFSQEGDRKAFVDFCAPYSNGANGVGKSIIMRALLPIYQAFLEEGGINAFVNFCAPYSDGANKRDKSFEMHCSFALKHTKAFENYTTRHL
jgi:hypothetical protein